MKTPAELFDLTGRVVVITGGSRGIGRAVAAGVATAGADVVIASRKYGACVEAAKEIEASTGRRALPVACNVSDWDDCDRLVETVYDTFGAVDALINNAGVSPLYESLSTVTRELYDKVHAINASGPFRLSVLIGERMAAGNGGSIINISTAGALRPGVGHLPYAMAKAGLNALTLGLAGAWAPKVRANVLLPGAFDTGAVEGWGADGLRDIAEMNPMKRLGAPEDLVGVCVFLASDASGYINGAQILADGGFFRTL
jgi:NAD(P)-dependent dehydrogenase (short-subunit alcohol dehydrogenase family)